MERITLSLEDPLLRAARDVALSREITMQQLLKDALKSELTRHYRKARSPVRADERLIALLRAKLSADFAYARDWADLMRRLHAQDIVIREAGGGLALFSLSTGARLCKASDIGFSLNVLKRKFHKPFPAEHIAQGWVATFTQDTMKNAARVPPGGAQNDIILIEDE